MVRKNENKQQPQWLSSPPLLHADWPGISLKDDPVTGGMKLVLMEMLTELLCKGAIKISTSASGEVATQGVPPPHQEKPNALTPDENHSGYTFRLAESSDLAALERCHSWFPALWSEDAASLLGESAITQTYLREVDGQVIGAITGMFVGINPNGLTPHWIRAMVVSLGVAPACRKRGVGRFLLEAYQRQVLSDYLAAVRQDHAMGVIALGTIVPQSLPDVQAFLAEQGFHRTPGGEEVGGVAFERYRPWWVGQQPSPLEEMSSLNQG